MSTADPDTGHLASPEGDASRQRRLALETESVAAADASVTAGYYATAAEVKAWIDSIGTDRPLPVPYPQHARPL